MFPPYPHPKTRTKKKHTHGKNPSLTVNGVENPESFCWGRDGWISPPFCRVSSTSEPQKAGQSSNLTCAYGSNGLVKKPPALGCFLLLGVIFLVIFFFCVWILLSICELESYLDNDKAPDFDRRRKFANGWKLLGCFFLPRFWTSSFESYLSSKDGVWAFKKMRKKSGRKCGRRNFRPKNKKTNAWMS